jgi:hypothetical protein
MARHDTGAGTFVTIVDDTHALVEGVEDAMRIDALARREQMSLAGR